VRRLGAALVASAGAVVAAAPSPLENLWPHPAGATWVYDRVRIEWGSRGAARTATTVRFQLGDSTTVGAGVVVQPLEVVSGDGVGPAVPALVAQLDVTGTGGNIVGRTRASTRGEMFYATGVGPVLARETFVPQAETTGAPPPPPFDSTFAELRLQAWALHPTAVEPVAWSDAKRLFR
jgi:hypothetical protein